MKISKRILTFAIVLVMITSTLICCSIKTISNISNAATRSPVRVGVLLYSFNDVFSSLLKTSLEDIQKENENKVEFTFFDGKANPATEIEIGNNMLNSNYDFIVVNLVDKRESDIIEEFIYKAKQKNIPLIFFNIKPAKLDIIKEYPKAIIIDTDTAQAGVLQGKMIADAWNINKETMDKNGDNIMQYIMLKGEPASFSTEVRTKNVISTINDARIKTQELASTSANWDQELAKSAIESLFLRYANKVEVIIANNDSMAIGAIQALQKYGYNMGDKSKYIPVFGIDAIPDAQDLIKKGFMAGTVVQDTRALAEAIYTVGTNLVSGNDPLEGTNYKFDESGVMILIPYKEYPIKPAS